MIHRFRRATGAVLFAFVVPGASEAAPASAVSTPSDATPCVEVRIGNDSAGRLDCLNRRLRAEVERTAGGTSSESHADAANAPPSRLGQPTPAALKERLGNAYGRSLVPQRPARTFAPPLPPVR